MIGEKPDVVLQSFWLSNKVKGDVDGVWKVIKERMLRLSPNLLLTAQQSCHYSFPNQGGPGIFPAKQHKQQQQKIIIHGDVPVFSRRKLQKEFVFLYVSPLVDPPNNVMQSTMGKQIKQICLTSNPPFFYPPILKVKQNPDDYNLQKIKTEISSLWMFSSADIL